MSVYYVLKKVAITHLRISTLGNELLLFVAMSLFVCSVNYVYIILLGQKSSFAYIRKKRAS